MTMNKPLQRILNERDIGISAAVLIPLGYRNLIFVSGEVGRDSSGYVVTGDFEVEARQCFENIKCALKRSGAEFQDVVKVSAYLKDLRDYPVYAKVRKELLGAHSPASTSVGVSDLLLGARLEVDAVAVVFSDLTGVEQAVS
jgi:2-iminobutanoate/2-iminopropanoate deaminase